MQVWGIVRSLITYTSEVGTGSSNSVIYFSVSKGFICTHACRDYIFVVMFFRMYVVAICRNCNTRYSIIQCSHLQFTPCGVG